LCTVTIVPREAGFRLVCNRDERRARPAAEPPEWRQDGALAQVWPRDPFSGGTWIGANAQGLTMVLLNRNPVPPVAAAPHPRSRGTIIPELLQSDSISSVLDQVKHLPLHQFQPFILLAIQDSCIAVATKRDARLLTNRYRLTRPLLFTTSSLGDDVVWSPRRGLFERLVERNPSQLAGQETFHQHTWRDRPDISVCMARPDAATVSRTTVDVHRKRVCLTYTPIAH
jgi:hypothetical protein